MNPLQANNSSCIRPSSEVDFLGTEIPLTDVEVTENEPQFEDVQVEESNISPAVLETILGILRDLQPLFKGKNLPHGLQGNFPLTLGDVRTLALQKLIIKVFQVDASIGSDLTILFPLFTRPWEVQDLNRFLSVHDPQNRRLVHALNRFSSFYALKDREIGAFLPSSPTSLNDMLGLLLFIKKTIKDVQTVFPSTSEIETYLKSKYNVIKSMDYKDFVDTPLKYTRLVSYTNTFLNQISSLRSLITQVADLKWVRNNLRTSSHDSLLNQSEKISKMILDHVQIFERITEALKSAPEASLNFDSSNTSKTDEVENFIESQMKYINEHTKTTTHKTKSIQHEKDYSKFVNYLIEYVEKVNKSLTNERFILFLSTQCVSKILTTNLFKVPKNQNNALKNFPVAVREFASHFILGYENLIKSMLNILYSECIEISLDKKEYHIKGFKDLLNKIVLILKECKKNVAKELFAKNSKSENFEIKLFCTVINEGYHKFAIYMLYHTLKENSKLFTTEQDLQSLVVSMLSAYRDALDQADTLAAAEYICFITTKSPVERCLSELKRLLSEIPRKSEECEEKEKIEQPTNKEQKRAYFHSRKNSESSDFTFETLSDSDEDEDEVMEADEKPSFFIPSNTIDFSKMSVQQCIQSLLFKCDGPAIPSLVSQVALKSIKTVHGQDACFSLDHVFWILELLTKMSYSEDKKEIKVLAPSLIELLHVALEKYVNYKKPGFLFHHNLVEGFSKLAKKITDKNKYGTFWARFPNFENAFYSREAPLALKTILESSGKLSEKKTQEVVKSLIEITLEAMIILQKEAIAALPVDDESNQKALNEKFRELIAKLIQLKNTPFTFTISDSKKLTQFHEEKAQLKIAIKKIKEKIDAFNLQRTSDQLFIEVCKDLIYHMKKVGSVIHALEKYPQKKYLSLHVRNFTLSMQYSFELLFEMHYLEEHQNEKTIEELVDDFKKFSHSLPRMFKELFKDTKGLSDADSVLRIFNAKKGVEYLNEKYFNRKKDMPLMLKLLDKAYQISKTAEGAGETFHPEGVPESPEKILEILKSNLALGLTLINRILNH